MKPRDEKKIAQIFEVTPQLVIKKGLSGITMSDIARAAKIATGTLYIYFKGKDELINAVFDSCRKASFESYLKGYDEREPFKTGFKKVWLNILKYRMEHFDEAIFIEQCSHSQFIKHTFKQLDMQQLQPLLSLIERGKREKLIKNVDSLLILVTMFGGITQIVKHIHYSQKELTKETIDTGFLLCWDGLKR